MSSPAAWATVGALGFGFVTWYFFMAGDDGPKRGQEDRKKKDSSPPPARVPASSVAVKDEERSEVRLVSKEQEKTETSVVTKECSTLSTARVFAEIATETRSVVSLVSEQETTEITAAELSSLDLGAALENLNSAPPVTEKNSPLKKIELPPKKSKGQARTTAMGLFGIAPAAPAAPEVPEVLAAVAAPLNAGERSGGLEFSYAAAEDANLKGLKRAKKVMTHGKGKARFEMQDAHSVFVPFQCSGISGAGLFCIFDGHAGKNCALECAAIVPKLAEKNIAELAMRGPLTDAREALEKTFLEADQALLKYEDEGATGLVVLTWLNHDGATRLLQCANVGDSAAFLCRDKSAVALTVDHKVTTPSERARVEALGVELGERATRIPGGLAVSRALGDHFLKSEKTGLIATPFVSNVFFLSSCDSAIVAASDALWDVMSGQDACVMMTRNDDAQSAANELLAAACKSTDNATVIVVRLH